MTQFNTVEEAIKDVREGKMILICDDESRENEGDIVIAAEKCTPDIITFMARKASGLICMPIIGERLEKLKIDRMVENNTDNHETAFTVSIDHVSNTTGISGYDRATTVLSVLAPNCKPEDLRRPGHMFPLRYKDGGVLVRNGHTEASVDIVRLAGLYPAAVICEVMKDDGTMARIPDHLEFCNRYGMKMISIASLIEYRKKVGDLQETFVNVPLPAER